jgi:hypothetical protein
MNEPMKKVKHIMSKWLQAVNKGELENLISLYNKKAVLIPTFSNRLLKNPEDIREYFIKLGNRENLSVDLHEKTLIIQKLKDSLYTASGIYCWRFSLDGEPLSFEARFTYIFDLLSASPILQHHSSQIPRTL